MIGIKIPMAHINIIRMFMHKQIYRKIKFTWAKF